ncbi:MAG: FAD-dependent oxidoreductase, partial [Simkaniaceae bacterium]|nr:FAD-dependent oxidoreductase [Simkaniaceae bacterium]
MEYFPYIVVGAGAAGLVVASGLAKAGKQVLLVDGGEEYFGCAASKALIASAKTAHSIRMAKEFGIEIPKCDLSCDGALKRTRKIVSEMRKKEEPAALKKLGIDTIKGTASFIDAHTIAVYDEEDNETLFHGKTFIIATGSSPKIPDIKGLERSSFSTIETVCDLKKVPKTLAILGGGKVGCELAQAFSRLGAQVHLFEKKKKLLPSEEPEVQKLVANFLEKEGIHLHFGASITKIEDLLCDHLVITTGRTPHIKHLNLDAAGVRYKEKTIDIDECGKTAQNHIWAIHDFIGSENQARAILASLLSSWNKKYTKQAVTRITYTDPEIASIGLKQKQAEKLFGKHKVSVYSLPLSDPLSEGVIKIVTKKRGSKILGATIVSERAGEMIMEIATAMHDKTSLSKLLDLIHPQETHNDAISKTADLHFMETLVKR